MRTPSLRVALAVLSCCVPALAALAALAAPAAPVAPAAQQSRNVTRLSVTAPSTDRSFSDVWGYVDPATGREYAILLGFSGAYVYNATDPRRPVLRAYIPGSASGWQNSDWRDARTYRHYLYVVTEGGSGMQIISLADPENPVLVRTHDTSRWGHTHNVSIDVGAGLCFACGTSGGMLVFDLAANPTNPPLVTRYTREYVHDMQADDGYAYLAEINRAWFRVLDIRNLPTMTSIAERVVGACHNTWPSRDGRICVATSETSGPGMTIFDTRIKSLPQRTASYNIGGVIHNAQVEDWLAHISYYSLGYRCVDLSDPWNPVEIGSYVSNNDWGVYGFQPSGVVYVSDIRLGLEILKPKATAVDYGVETPGTGGRAPQLHTFGAAWLGNVHFRVEIDDGPPGNGAFFVVGTRRTDVDLAGLRILVEPLSAPAIVFVDQIEATGYAKAHLSIPNDQSLNGVELNAQAIVVDPNGPLGLAASAGKTFEIFVP